MPEKQTKIRYVGAARRYTLLLLVVACIVQPLTAKAQYRENQRRSQSAEQRSSRKAVAIYSDAAGFQNNAAYDLAIEEWQKLLKEFPRDPLASKAAHYLGVCYIQLEKPDYAKGISAFERALQDSKLELREESLINLSWCLFNQAREADPGSGEQRNGLLKAKSRLTEFLSKYGRGSYVDQALFYLGEIEYTLGSPTRAISYYKKLLDSRSFAKSNLRPDTRYALAVAYEEDKQASAAIKQYQTFLREHAEHRLASEVKVRLADLMLSSNKPGDAEDLLSSLSRDDAELADYALLRLGYSLSQQGRAEEAAQKYMQLLRDHPDSPHASTAALSVGQTLYSNGKYDEAIRQFQKALAKKDAQAGEAAHWIAITYLRQNKPESAESFLNDVREWSQRLPTYVTLQMDYADSLYAQPAKLAKARAAYELIAKENPDDSLAPRATYNVAFAALQQGDYADARTWSENFLSRYPQDALRNDVAYVAAEALLLEGEHEAAARAYQKLRSADSLNDAYPLWTVRLGMAHYLSGEYEEAIKLLRSEVTTLRDNKQKAEAQYILGASLLYQEQPTAAIKQLQASHQTSDSWNSADEVLLLLAEAYQRSNDNRSAKETLESLLRKFPRTRLKGQVEYKLAQLSAAMNQLEDAISQYRSIVRNPEASNLHVFANYGIAWCLMQQGQHQQALRILQPLLRAGSSSSIADEIRLAEGVCLRKVGQLDQSVSALTRYLRTDPKGTALGNGLYELGLAYTEQGQTEKANEQFLNILRNVSNYAAEDKVLYELAWNYDDLSDTRRSAYYFKRLANEHPSSEFSGEATYMLAQQQYDSEQYDKAAQTYISVMKRTRDSELLEKSQYKLGWSLFQQERFSEAADAFDEQAANYPTGSLAVDALFMHAECLFKQNNFDKALNGYRKARGTFEANRRSSAASDQVQTLIYLHGAQCLREQKRWQECEDWLQVVIDRYADSPYLATALYELAFCKQNLKDTQKALELYEEVASEYRNEIGARARFMRGEIYFGARDFPTAIKEFQRVMYGFGADKAPESIKNWQVKSAFEAARCTEVLLENPRGFSRDKLVKNAQDFYRFIVEKHAAHDMAAKAQSRLGELQRLR